MKYLFYTSYSYNSISRYAYRGISAHIPRRDLVIFSRDLVIFSSWHASNIHTYIHTYIFCSSQLLLMIFFLLK